MPFTQNVQPMLLADLVNLVLDLPPPVLPRKRHLAMDVIEQPAAALDQQDGLIPADIAPDDLRFVEIPVDFIGPIVEVVLARAVFLLPEFLFAGREQIVDRLPVALLHRRVVRAIHPADFAPIAGEWLSPFSGSDRDVELDIETPAIAAEGKPAFGVLSGDADRRFDARVAAERAAVAGHELVGNAVILPIGFKL